jgi:hypothetical protein
MSISINGTNGLTFSDASTQNTAASGFGFKNRLINGAMVIDQRNAGASVTPASSGYTLDRWRAAMSLASKFSVQQSSIVPSGFTNSSLITSLSAYTVGTSENFRFEQFVEGFNASDLGWGTASAQTVTLSFWVRSSLIGTFGGAFLNSVENRSYPFSYTISAANTWEQKSIPVVGDTSGTWLTNNGIGIRVSFSLGAGATVSGTAGSWSGNFYTSATGATSVVGTAGATFYITGVQLEKGSTATSFDYRPYGTELALCQRYYEKSFDIGTAPANGPNGTSFSSNNGLFGACSLNGGYPSAFCTFQVSKRAVPTFLAYGNNLGYWSYANGTWVSTTAGVVGVGTSGFGVAQQSVASITTIQGHWTASAEL